MPQKPKDIPEAPYMPSNIGMDTTPQDPPLPPALLGALLQSRPPDPQVQPMRDPRIAGLNTQLDAMNNQPPSSLIDRIGTIARGVQFGNPQQFAQQEQSRLGQQFDQQQQKRQALMQQLNSALQQEQQGKENVRQQGQDAITRQRQATADSMQAQTFPLEQRKLAAEATSAEHKITEPDLMITNPGDTVISKDNPSKPLFTNAPKPIKKTFQQKEIMGPQGGKGDPLPAGYDPETNKYYDSQGVEIPDAKPYQRAFQPKDTTESDRNRIERSFNSRASEIEKAGQPVSDGLQRVGRLMDTLNNGSPLADSVTAPELLVVMAGGQGSGVKITQSEINSIVGGQSHWEQMKSALQQWNTDPAKANKILEPMRNQIKSLVSKVNEKLSAKEAAIEDARQKLIDTDDPKQHKQIVADTKKALASIDTGTAPSNPQGGKPAQQPKTMILNGKTLTLGADGKYH